MITYRKGDVLDALEASEVDVVIHQTNCQGVMGSGIAKQIKTRFPAVYEVYKDLEKHNGKLLLGDVSGATILRVDKDDKLTKSGMILNVNGQDKYANRSICNTNYAALGKGLLYCLNFIEDDSIVAMPKIGAGLGGGDWYVIEAIINSVFPEREVFVYEL
jgi:O-acetyl-ADP-ribose deacetylase (regulator of RNase III)